MKSSSWLAVMETLARGIFWIWGRPMGHVLIDGETVQARHWCARFACCGYRRAGKKLSIGQFGARWKEDALSKRLSAEMMPRRCPASRDGKARVGTWWLEGIRALKPRRLQARLLSAIKIRATPAGNPYRFALTKTCKRPDVRPKMRLRS